MSVEEEVKEYLKKLPPAPAGVERWIRKELVEHAYILYSRKANEAVCTRCGRKYTMKRFPEARHNILCSCPGCGTKAKYKAAHYGRKKLTEQFRILLFTHRGKTVYGTLFEVDADFKSFGKPQIHRWLSALYVFTEKEQKYFKHHPGGFWNGEYWEQPKDIRLPKAPTGYAWGRWSKYERTEIYTENLEAVFTKSCLKYHWAPDFFQRHKFGPYKYTRYMAQSLKYQAVELLRKAGFEELVMERVRGYGTGSLYMGGKNLTSVLRLPKRWHKKIRELNMGDLDLKTFQRLGEKEKKEVTRGLLDELRAAELYEEEIEQYVSFFAAARYVEKQRKQIYLYRDYLRMASELGWDLTRKRILYPDNLQRAHDEVMDLRKEQREEIATEKMKKQVEKIVKELPEFRAGELLIRAARSQEELNRESQALTHCVRSYGERIINGACMIFFIRKTADPDTPFYTLELNKKKELVQCRGDHNRGMTEEVETFVNLWLAKIQKKEKKEVA